MGGDRIMASNYCGRSSLPSSESLQFQQNCSKTTLEELEKVRKGTPGSPGPGRDAALGGDVLSIPAFHAYGDLNCLVALGVQPCPRLLLLLHVFAFRVAKHDGKEGPPLQASSASHGNYPK